MIPEATPEDLKQDLEAAWKQVDWDHEEVERFLILAAHHKQEADRLQGCFANEAEAASFWQAKGRHADRDADRITTLEAALVKIEGMCHPPTLIGADDMGEVARRALTQTEEKT